ncbi:hypothetical protein CYY_008506 [Polysphondylium violaceum]|uniref:AMMECR1 domain-containing protein n=1 Tax=Polysphondylium violaceum TaxID=133409 RepID=A0A8J4PMX3_9MYCE|nr:hypothetical protein CYY_008506 [Polysphondylium violaceum]
MASKIARVKATSEMVQYCFDSLVCHFENKELYVPTFTNDSFPLFVTWKIDSNSSEEPELRGCIGTFSPRPLIEGLNKFALTSALKDSRFKPISSKELPKLHCSVSLLVEFEDAQDCWDWDIGTHGIWIEFNDSHTTRNATYLPEVMPEQGWTKEETMKSLVRKAGYQGKVDSSLYSKIKLTRYQSSKYSLSFQEYKNLSQK